MSTNYVKCPDCTMPKHRCICHLGLPIARFVNPWGQRFKGPANGLKVGQHTDTGARLTSFVKPNKENE